MTRSTYVYYLTMLGLLLGNCNVALAQQHKPQKPNIIYILMDDLGIGDVGVYYQNRRKAEQNRNHPYMQTPNIDGLAVSGAQLNQGYVNAPVCVASRASLLLGASQGQTKVRDNQFDKALDSNYNLANTLKEAGYTTAAIGKWGLQGKGKVWPAHPRKIGFDYYYGYIRHSDGHEHYPKEGKYRGSKEVYDNFTNVTPGLDKCYTGDLWTARAKQWIIAYSQANPKDKPFFMYLAYDTPHAVTELPTQAYPAGAGLKGGLQWLGKPGEMINTASGEIDSWIAPEYAQATWDHDNNPSTAEQPWPNVYKRYATSVKRIDDQVGDILQLLKDLGIADNTLLIFTSDNGPSKESYLKEEYSPEFFRGYGAFDGIKRDLWEGGVRAPFLVQWPNHIKPGTVINDPMMASDWLATFLDAAGYTIPAHVDGKSLIPVLTGTGKKEPSKVYVEYAQNQRTPDYADFEPARRNRLRQQMQSVRIGDYMGVRYDIQSPRDPFEIYNVVLDPQQRTNLASKPEFKALQEQMQRKVTQMRRPDKDAPRPYDSVYVAAEVVTGRKKGRLESKLYHTDESWVSSGYGLKALKTKRIKSLNSASLPYALHASYVVKGYIDVPADGTYVFNFQSNGKAVFKLHDILVIDADYAYKGEAIQEEIRLKAGLHPFRFYYRPASSNSRFSLTYSDQRGQTKEIK